MEINPSKFMGMVTGVVSIGLVLGSGYFLYMIFFKGPEVKPAATLETVNATMFGPKVQQAAVLLTGVGQKASFKKKDLAFTEASLFKSFTDLPEVVPLSDSRGRPDPFVPYAAP